MSKKDAAMFPIIASCALFGLYIFFKVLVVNIVVIINSNSSYFVSPKGNFLSLTSCSSLYLVI